MVNFRTFLRGTKKTRKIKIKKLYRFQRERRSVLHKNLCKKIWIRKSCWGSAVLICPRWDGQIPSYGRSSVEQRQRLDCFDYPSERVPYAVTVVGRADWPQIITAMRQQLATRFVFNVGSRCCPYQQHCLKRSLWPL